MSANFRQTPFGQMLKFEHPKDHELVLLCINRASYQPVTLLLPHQVYRERLQQLLKQYPDASGFTIFPINSAHKISVPISSAQPHPETREGEPEMVCRRCKKVVPLHKVSEIAWEGPFPGQSLATCSDCCEDTA